METEPDTTDDTPDERKRSDNALKELIGAIRATVDNTLDLLATESRLAGLTLVRMLILAVGLGITALTAWLCLVAAVISWFATGAGDWPAAFGGGAAINAIAAYILWRWVFGLSERLSFSALRENLRGEDAARRKVSTDTDRSRSDRIEAPSA